MAIDAGIKNADPDGCLYIDNPKPTPYYLSPNVVMSRTPPDLNDVYLGANNTNVTVTWSGECQIPEQKTNPDLFQVNFDLFICDPFLGSMTPGTPSVSTLAKTFPTNGVSSGGTPIGPGNSITTTVGPWNNPANVPVLSDPSHACLVARVYPFPSSPDTGDLSNYPAEDLHYAQHNCAVYTSAPSPRPLIIQINNGTAQREPELVAIQAVPDLNPNKLVLDTVLPSLQLIPTFKQISNKPLPPVKFDLSAFKSPHESLLEKIFEWIEKEIMELIEELEGKCRKAGGTHARVVLPPNSSAKFGLIVDLSKANPGDAYIYQVSQVNGKGQPYGGVTVVIAAT